VSVRARFCVCVSVCVCVCVWTERRSSSACGLAWTGARISFVFHEIFANGIRDLDPFDHVSDADIRTILYNASVR
jgi:hypothetical protein